MTQKKRFRILLILAIFFLAFGGWLLHLQMHPIGEDSKYYIPAAAGFISVIITPLLFVFRRTVPLAYLLNGMTVIIGTIAMVDFSLAHRPDVWNIKTILLGTLLANIILLWGKFALGKSLFEMELALRQPDAPVRRGRFLRYPNMGFWLVHVFTLSAVYIIGRLLWK
jgi:hypothetical protein